MSAEDGAHGDEYDLAAARAEEAAYRTEGAAERRRFVRETLTPTPGEAVVSVGAGPGFEPLELAESVGSTGRVVGVDRSRPMTRLARERLSGVSNAAVVAGDATALPLPDGVADAATAVQVLQYLASPRAALAEIRRVLHPSGRAVVFLVDWDTFPVRGTDQSRTERVLTAWRDHCRHPTLGSRLREPASAAGLAVRSVEPYAVAADEPTDGTFAGHLLDFVAEFAADHGTVDAAEATRWREDLAAATDRGEAFVGLTGYCHLLAPASAR
ncbi:methyltransferase domain-containing protein [Halobaculum lipolyticum]|uniref:Methyltransferase domain-containing protein n=1 Tax=Halobaculum lipolyticum TaxID=3032001 RepID=A0ABD5W5A5_9EURY|nr:methyltransferase domain-containing protein [Halobaculum sp. DT31]